MTLIGKFSCYFLWSTVEKISYHCVFIDQSFSCSKSFLSCVNMLMGFWIITMFCIRTPLWNGESPRPQFPSSYKILLLLKTAPWSDKYLRPDKVFKIIVTKCSQKTVKIFYSNFITKQCSFFLLLKILPKGTVNVFLKTPHVIMK